MTFTMSIGYYIILLLIPIACFFWVIKRYLFKHILLIEDKKQKRSFAIKLILLLFCVLLIGILRKCVSLQYHLVGHYPYRYYERLIIDQPAIAYTHEEGTTKSFELSPGDTCAVFAGHRYDDRMRVICPGKGVGYIIQTAQNQPSYDTN